MRLSKSDKKRDHKVSPIAVTMGDTRGISGELTIKAWNAKSSETVPPFFAIDHPDRLNALAEQLKLPLKVSVIETPSTAVSVFDTALPVIPIDKVTSGKTNCASQTIASIEHAVDLVLGKQAKAMVTNPINKKNLYDAGFTFQGHTDFLEHLASQHTGTSCRSIMMLASQSLRTVPVTVHIPLHAVPGALSQDALIECAEIVAAALHTDFGIREPRLAVAGLNPHAGEGGSIGNEDQEIIEPAIEKLRHKGLQVEGPLPADTMFHERARTQYDAALCMYHDQALIPLKTLDFDKGVNVTLGLPFIRTSPDHGTAYDIAGTGKADPTSFLEALRLADQLADNRQRASSLH